MIKLAKLFEKIESFYDKSLQALSNSETLAAFAAFEGEEVEEYDGVVPEEIPDIIEALENLSYDIKGEVFAAQFEQFVEVYKEFINNQFDAENAEALNTVFSRLANNPYLKLQPEDVRWQETFPPIKAIDLLFAAKNSADKKMKQDLDDPTASIEQADGINQEFIAASEDPQGKGYKDTDANIISGGNRLQQMKDAHKRHREKRLAAGKYYTLENLEQKLKEATDPAEKEILNKLLLNYNSFLKMRANQARVYSAIQADPARATKYRETGKARAATFLETTKKKMELVKAIKEAKTPADKIQAAKQLIALEKSTISRSGLDLDNPEVENNPVVKDLLNPENLIKKIEGRVDRLKEYQKRRTSRRQNQRAEGNIDGLLLILSGQISNALSANKKAINARIDANKEKEYSSPFFAQHIATLKEAVKQTITNPSPDATKRKEAAEMALAQALDVYKQQQIAEENKKLTALEEVKEQLHALAGSTRGKAPKKRTPWFWEPVIPEEKKPLVYQLIVKIETVVMQIQNNMPKVTETLRNIAQQLRDKIK